MSRSIDLVSARVCFVWIWAVLAGACRLAPGPHHAPPAAPPTTASAPAAPEPPAPAGKPHVPPAGYTHAFPLRTDGRFIVDANGYRFKIAGVNWYGAEAPDFVAGGLDRQPLAAIVASIRSMGFNTVRLPWSNALLATNPRVDDKLLAREPSTPRSSRHGHLRCRDRRAHA